MSITEYYGKVLGVTHTPVECSICTITQTEAVRTSVKVWSKR
jgi:hypothetical protein